MKNLFQLISPLVFMLFFVTVAGAQSETKCDPNECTVKCCSPKTCSELVSSGICTPDQVSACKTAGEPRVASAEIVKGEVKAASCTPSMSMTCAKKDKNKCSTAATKLVSVEKLEITKIKPVTKVQ